MIANFLSKTMENFKRNIRQGNFKVGGGGPRRVSHPRNASNISLQKWR